MNKGFFKKIWMLLIFLIPVLIVAGCTRASQRKQTDLKSFYGIMSDNEYVILLEGENIGKAYKEGDEIYLPYELVNNEINDRFYLDKENNRIFYTDIAVQSFDIGSDSNTKVIKDTVYISFNCIKDRTEMNGTVYENPNRVVISQNFGTISVCKPVKDNVIRQYNRDNSDYMAEVSEGESLIIKEKMNESWYRVVKDNGITGYIKANETNGEETEERQSSYKKPEYTHITMDQKVCMGWHQVTSKAANNTLEEVTRNAKGSLNVISPTWLKLADTTGNISSLAQASYVEKAHNMGMQVWVLADDFSYGEDGSYFVSAVLGNYDSRQRLINNLVSEVINCNADGLNIDYEKIYEEMADDYIQFIRELSIECRKNGLVLSVDTYVMQSYNEFYNRKGIAEAADYLVIMGYDEHWAGDNSAGSVASLPYVKKGIEDAKVCADAKRIINGIPFFTRVWTETKEGLTSEGTYVEDPINGNYWLTSIAVGMDSAEQKLSSQGITPTWLEDLGQYYGEYEAEGIRERIWLEDERSVQEKLNVMSEAGIGGVACWKLGLEKAAVWEEIQEYMK